jgi:hypothetical protein
MTTFPEELATRFVQGAMNATPLDPLLMFALWLPMARWAREFEQAIGVPWPPTSPIHA